MEQKAVDDYVTACSCGWLSKVAAFLDAGGEIDLPDSIGATGLTAAVLREHSAVVSLLIERKADVQRADENGCTPLICAAMHHKDPRVTHMLLKAGADPGTAEYEGKTALQWARQRGRVAVAQLLFEQPGTAAPPAAAAPTKPAPQPAPQPPLSEGTPSVESTRLQAMLEERQATRTLLQQMGEDTAVIDADIAELTAVLTAATAGAGRDQEPEPEPEPEVAAMAAVPPSPMSGRTLASSHFLKAYGKAKAPNSLVKLGSTLGRMLEGYCDAHCIPFDDGEGEAFLDQLQKDMDDGDSLIDAVQRMWTSFRQLRGREFCSILNEVVRDDDPERVKPAAALTRAINELCVTADGRLPQPPFPPGFVCHRGGGFDDRYRDFFVAGRAFRQPAFLATSFSGSTADSFIARSTMPSKVKWLVRIDPALKCRHVNLVTKRVPDLEDEQEYLFAPYSAFTVLSTKWGDGTAADPHVIELAAAPDNKGPSEHLPLAPWS